MVKKKKLFSEYNSDDTFRSEVNWLYISSCLELAQCQMQRVGRRCDSQHSNSLYSDGNVLVGFGPGLTTGWGYGMSGRKEGVDQVL